MGFFMGVLNTYFPSSIFVLCLRSYDERVTNNNRTAIKFDKLTLADIKMILYVLDKYTRWALI